MYKIKKVLVVDDESDICSTLVTGMGERKSSNNLMATAVEQRTSEQQSQQEQRTMSRKKLSIQILST
jgi:hypothetical protein